jgi:hypothetical protein
MPVTMGNRLQIVKAFSGAAVVNLWQRSGSPAGRTPKTTRKRRFSSRARLPIQHFAVIKPNAQKTALFLGNSTRSGRSLPLRDICEIGRDNY